jgi:hypothetical protein
MRTFNRYSEKHKSFSEFIVSHERRVVCQKYQKTIEKVATSQKSTVRIEFVALVFAFGGELGVTATVDY